MRACYKNELVHACLSNIFVRIISGSLKGHKLLVPKGLSVRPTSDKVKESLFNIIAADVPGANVLDAFAGTGNIGIEALSRGAETAVFLEKSPSHIRILRQNLTACRVQTQSQVYCGDANKLLHRLRKASRRFDLIYLDPPYRQTGMLQDLLNRLITEELITESGLLIAEHARSFTPPASIGECWTLSDVRRIGDTGLSFYCRNEHQSINLYTGKESQP